MSVALVIGSARTLDDDLEAALGMFTPAIVVATEYSGEQWKERFPRRLQGHVAGEPQRFGTGFFRRGLEPINGSRHWRRARDQFGLIDHGFQAVLAALVYADKVVLAGMPMSREFGHIRTDGWREEVIPTRARWQAHEARLRNRVRSLSGWTKTLFGEPTSAWLSAPASGPFQFDGILSPLPGGPEPVASNFALTLGRDEISGKHATLERWGLPVAVEVGYEIVLLGIFRDDVFRPRARFTVESVDPFRARTRYENGRHITGPDRAFADPLAFQAWVESRTFVVHPRWPPRSGVAGLVELHEVID